MYKKPRLERFGTLRELTLIGLGSDGDGGIQGWGRIVASVTDGCAWGCNNRS
ncbi:lasso RiPP family leader peptide-containing protein [Gaopeijia maritima]|uniref:Lasso RiPP family leader peptide-containing protein n=1 Tax=Gaopeijia maritima TaxID=3119007 RepID=A0ABU9E5Q6_9BACT